MKNKTLCPPTGGNLMRDQIKDEWVNDLKTIRAAAKEQAERYNRGKPEYSLIALDCLQDCAKVLAFGAKKYSRNNWRKGMDQTTILDSLLRHIAALQSGETVDPESGLPHIGHIQCNAMFLGNSNNYCDLEQEYDTL